MDQPRLGLHRMEGDSHLEVALLEQDSMGEGLLVVLMIAAEEGPVEECCHSVVGE